MQILNKFLASNSNVTEEIDAEAASLATMELGWRDKQKFLQSKGYMLRPRFRPGWIPSWTLPGNAMKIPITCEDYEPILVRLTAAVCCYMLTCCVTVALRLGQPHSNSIDATRISDGRRVYIKRVKTGGHELHIATLFPSGPFISHPRNHCVPILDQFDDADDWVTYLVMPFLRRFDDPPFETVADVIDFVSQIDDVRGHPSTSGKCFKKIVQY